MVLVPKWPFFQLFFLGNIGPEESFYDILERINAFKAYKNKKLKNSKNCHYSNGVNPWFWSKIGHFPTFFFGNVGHEIVFYDILEQKKRLSRLWKQEIQKAKHWHFSKGVNPLFWSKNGHFSKFFFWKYRRGNCVLRYSRPNKRLSSL